MTNGEGNHKDNSDCHGNDDVEADSPRGTVGYRSTDQGPKGQSSAFNGAANPKNGGPTLERCGVGNDAGRISVYYTIARVRWRPHMLMPELMPAAPKPLNARPRMNDTDDGAAAVRTEPTVKIENDVM